MGYGTHQPKHVAPAAVFHCIQERGRSGWEGGGGGLKAELTMPRFRLASIMGVRVFLIQW